MSNSIHFIPIQCGSNYCVCVCAITLSWDGILKTIVTSKFILNVLLYNAPTVIRARAECTFAQDSLETGISNVSTVSVLKEKKKPNENVPRLMLQLQGVHC